MLILVLLANPFKVWLFSAVSLFLDHKHLSALLADQLCMLPQSVLLPLRNPASNE
jgi:hypothetical protein